MIEMAGLDPDSLEKIVKKYCEDASENTVIKSSKTIPNPFFKFLSK